MGLLMLFGDISSDVGLLPDGTKAVYWETMRGCDETDSSFCSSLWWSSSPVNIKIFIRKRLHH